jgi:rRNA maturation endonuclease Nob1
VKIGIALAEGALREHVLQVSEDDQALFDDAVVRGLEDPERRRAARLLEERGLARLRDVDDAEVNGVSHALQREGDLGALAERADGGVVDGRAGHGASRRIGAPSRGTKHGLQPRKRQSLRPLASRKR